MSGPSYTLGCTREEAVLLIQHDATINLPGESNNNYGRFLRYIELPPGKRTYRGFLAEFPDETIEYDSLRVLGSRFLWNYRAREYDTQLFDRTHSRRKLEMLENYAKLQGWGAEKANELVETALSEPSDVKAASLLKLGGELHKQTLIDFREQMIARENAAVALEKVRAQLKIGLEKNKDDDNDDLD